MTPLQSELKLLTDAQEAKDALRVCAEELGSILGLHGASDESTKLENSAALRLAKEILGDELAL